MDSLPDEYVDPVKSGCSKEGHLMCILCQISNIGKINWNQHDARIGSIEINGILWERAGTNLKPARG